MLFLIEYDRNKGQIVTLQSFGEADKQVADQARLELELFLNQVGKDHEVVVLEAASEAALRITHRRYFEDLGQLVKVP